MLSGIAGILLGDLVALDATTLTFIVISSVAAALIAQMRSIVITFLADRFFETKRQALSWARQNPSFMTVRVIPPNYRPQPQPTRLSQQSQMIGNSALPANNRSRFDKAPLSLLKPGYRVP